VNEIKALLGEERFAALLWQVFTVEYFAGRFGELKKTSITPRIEFDLGDEHGYGSPDASAGLGKDHFSMRWTGTLRPMINGTYTFIGESDGELRLWIDDALVIDGPGRRQAKLTAGKPYRLKVEYAHNTGDARCRVRWSGPGVPEQALTVSGPW
jgi:hypothetical protein